MWHIGGISELEKKFHVIFITIILVIYFIYQLKYSKSIKKNLLHQQDLYKKKTTRYITIISSSNLKTKSQIKNKKSQIPNLILYFSVLLHLLL
jgi:hypothetical protein